jgi:hypothetical protein
MDQDAHLEVKMREYYPPQELLSMLVMLWILLLPSAEHPLLEHAF